MPTLSAPTAAVRTSFLAAMAEFRAEGRGGPDDDSMIGHEHRRFATTWTTPEGFEDYAQDLRAAALEESPRPAGYVPCTTWWWLDGDEYFARIALRHRLTPHLLDVGGHIGYDTRPSARRKGHATAMLHAVLPHVRALGIDRALVTCNHDNVGSIKVIASAGGVLEDRRGDKLRYWVPTR